jgi:glucose-6-phosphate isomerase
MEFLARESQAKVLRWDHQCTVITETTQNPLNDWATERNIPILEIPKDVGGRFSVLSPVGFLPAALALGDLDPLRSGIQWALKQPTLACGLAQASMESFRRGEWITVLWHYSDALYDGALWWQQLWAESLAKAKDVNGDRPGRVSTPMVARGAQDQHSLLQQFMEGEKDKWFWFHSISRPAQTAALGPTMVKSPWPLQGHTLADVMQAEMQGIESSLNENGVSSLHFRWSDFTPQTAAAYFMFTQIVVGTLGELLKINAYDQPGVELGKKRARDILSKKVAALPYQT